MSGTHETVLCSKWHISLAPDAVWIAAPDALTASEARLMAYHLETKAGNE